MDAPYPALLSHSLLLLAVVTFQEVSTRIGRRPNTITTTSSSTSTAPLNEFLVGNALLQAEQAGEPLEIVHPFQNGPRGLQVVDWLATEALLCVISRHYELKLIPS